MGLLSGLIGFFAVLPTAGAAYAYYVRAEAGLAGRQAFVVAQAVGSWLQAPPRSIDLSPQLAPLTTRFAPFAQAVVVLDDQGVVYQWGASPLVDPSWFASLCEQTPSGYTQAMDANWACAQAGPYQVVAGVRIQQPPLGNIVALALALSTIVGILSAFGVIRVLAPLPRVSEALKRVSLGERGVRVEPSGFPELDELVYRLNTAAQAVEERQDAALSRIQVVQEMARMVAHEIRNPLQSMEMLTSLVASEQQPEERMDIAKAMHDEIRGLDQVVTRLLKRGAGDSLRLVRSMESLSDIVNQVVAMRLPEVQSKGIELWVGATVRIGAFVDAALLSRSIENLIRNSMHAVPKPGGTIRVQVVEQAGYGVIAVDDNGPGVDESIRNHIFDAHVTSRESGTGLGLALVKGVVEAHQGHVEYRVSELGGACFLVFLPIDEAQYDTKPP